MKKYLLFVAFLCMTGTGFSQQKESMDYGLPVLHLIQEVSLSPSYSCRSSEDFRKGYAETSLFLSAYSKQRNSPDLVFDGACNSDDSFEASTAGNDMALIADLGENVSLESLTAQKTFNINNIARNDSYTKFTKRINVLKDHTYAVLLNKSEIRGLFVFSVVGYEKNKKVTLKYAVKMYEIFPNSIRAEDFNWQKENTKQ
jgi:hypothetical protein